MRVVGAWVTAMVHEAGPFWKPGLRPPGARQGAFSLAELVISMGILLLMMALAGQVFNLTVQSTGQATALTEVMQELRVFEQTLREDLRHVQPGNSVLLIHGNPVNAYWTQRDRDVDVDGAASGDGPRTGYDHPADPEREDADGNLLAPRADILMFFTARRGSSFAEAGTGMTSNLQQVVYGHAELGEYVASDTAAGGYEFHPVRGTVDPQGQLDRPMFPVDAVAGAKYASTTRVADVAAEEWHLARRSVLLLSADGPAPTPPAQPVRRLDDVKLLRGETDVTWLRDMPGPKPSGNGYEDVVLRAWVDPTSGELAPPWYLPPVFGDLSKPYAQWFKPFERSRMDSTPPAVLASRLGHFMLPRCASFKVEWALNPHSEFVAGRLDGAGEVFWFDPGDNGDPSDAAVKPDPLRSLEERIKALKKGASVCGANDTLCQSLDALLNQCTFHPDRGQRGDGLYSLSDRFRGPNFSPSCDPEAVWEPLAPDGKRTNLVVFTASKPPAYCPTPPCEPVPDDMFPGALRVTVDVFDKDRRLDRPIRHVMVIPIGG